LNKKIKLLDSNFDKETGISNVTILTDIGKFSGSSKLHEEDKEISSSYAGCSYAEMRALIKYMKQKIKYIEAQIKALQSLQLDLQGRTDYNHLSPENYVIRRHIYELKKNIKQWEEKIDSLHTRMLNNMEQREKVIKSITNKNKKGEE